MKKILIFSLVFTCMIPAFMYCDTVVICQNILFERDKMSLTPSGKRVEGYWAGSSDPKRDQYKGRYPFPIAHENAWNGKEEFIQKMAKMEDAAGEAFVDNPERIVKIVTRGISHSRLENAGVGNCEFEDTQMGIVWTQGLGSHYFGKHNVIPSREFYDYIMSFPEELLK